MNLEYMNIYEHIIFLESKTAQSGLLKETPERGVVSVQS